MPECQPQMSVDRALELVASTRRRRLLRYFLEEPDTPVQRAELASYLHPEDDLGLSSLELTLAHHHLPKLADSGVIEYDHRSGAVRPTEAVEVFEPLLAICDELETALK